MTNCFMRPNGDWDKKTTGKQTPIFDSAFVLWANAKLYILVPSLTP